MPENSDVVVSNRPFEVGVRYAQLSILELINAQLRLLVGHIEQIGSEMERRPLTDFVAIVGVEVSISSCRRTAQSPMAFGRSLATVLVNRMSSQVVNRNPGLDTDSGSQRQVLCEAVRSEEHTSELQSRGHLVCRLLLEKKKKINNDTAKALSWQP